MSRPNVIDIYEAPFTMYDDLRSEGAREGLRASTHLQRTPLSDAFFGGANVERLQAALRAEILKRTGYAIDRQSDEQLLIVMRYVFMQSARHQGGEEEVARLNGLVLREIVPQVGAGLAQYLAYLRDASTLPTPIPRGQATSIKGTKPNELFRPL